MKWMEVCVTTCREFADIVSLALIDEGSEGTVIRDSNDIKEMLNSGIIWDYVDENLLANSDPRVFVSGFFSTSADVNAIVELLNELRNQTDMDTGSFEISIAQLDSSDWENEWKKYYQPIEFKDFAIVPEWIKNHGILGKKIIKLNPGMAFGTGTHETTSMCLKLMEDIDFANKTVIDLGCGSGILGITAAMLGAEMTLLTDIDDYAVKCSKENAVLNSLASSIVIKKTDLLKEGMEIKADVLTANLTAPLLLLAKEGIKNHLLEGGILIVSGILGDYDEEVLSEYKAHFDIICSQAKGDWRAHKFIKK